jgi:hypothetical protein
MSATKFGSSGTHAPQRPLEDALRDQAVVERQPSPPLPMRAPLPSRFAIPCTATGCPLPPVAGSRQLLDSWGL